MHHCEANLEGQEWQKNTVNQFFGSNLWVQIFLKMREYQKKGALKQKIEASLYTLDWGFKKIPFTLYTYVSAKILQNGAKFRYAKTGFKNYMNLNFTQAVESPESSKLMCFCPKKNNIPLAKIYTVDSSTITFNYLCVESPNYLPFLKP